MADTPVTQSRPDLDILEDIEKAIVRYPPLVNDRHRVQIAVHNGVVTLSGHLKTSVTCQHLVDAVRQVAGVTRVHSDQLYNDDTLRREAGALIPSGVFVNVEYGTVLVTGKLPAGTDAAALEARIGAMPGIRQVVMRATGDA